MKPRPSKPNVMVIGADSFDIGFAEFRSGKPFDPDYGSKFARKTACGETDAFNEQRHYEAGRLSAAERYRRRAA